MTIQRAWIEEMKESGNYKMEGERVGRLLNTPIFTAFVAAGDLVEFENGEQNFLKPVKVLSRPLATARFVAVLSPVNPFKLMEVVDQLFHLKWRNPEAPDMVQFFCPNLFLLASLTSDEEIVGKMREYGIKGAVRKLEDVEIPPYPGILAHCKPLYIPTGVVGCS